MQGRLLALGHSEGLRRRLGFSRSLFRHPDRSDPVFSFALVLGAPGRAVEGPWQHQNHSHQLCGNHCY
jgi:hypothetical protein